MLLRKNVTVAAVLLALGAACQTVHADEIAVVNGEPITRSEFGRSLVGSLGRSVMDTFIDRALIEQEARRLGITVTDAELSERKALEIALRLRAVQQNSRMGPEEFQTLAGLLGWDLDELRSQVERGISDGALRIMLLAERILEPTLDLSDEALRNHYERTRGQRYAAAHIVVGGRSRAERLLTMLRDRLELWPQAVLQVSLDRASVPYKGRIGPVPAASRLGKVLSGMQPGELKLHQEGELWLVLRFIKEIPPASEDFEAIKTQLRAELAVAAARDEFNALLAGLNWDAHVVVNMSFDSRARHLLGEETAVYVNGESLPVAELADALVEEFGPSMLESYIERMLIMQQARRRGLTVSDEEFEARLEAIGEQLFEEQAAQRGVTTEDMVQRLAASGVDAAKFKEDLVQQLASPTDVRATLLGERMVENGVEVAEGDISDAYREFCEGRCIVRELAADSSDSAEQLRRRIRQGADFDMLARTEPSGPGAWLAGSRIEAVTSSHPYYPYVKSLKVGDVS
ncbi:MAG: hypothetical protein ACYS8L_04695, partial [Planctomycetota bacterium]